MKYLKRLFWLPYLAILHWNRSRLIVEVEDQQFRLWHLCDTFPHMSHTEEARTLECLAEQLADMETRICYFWENH